MAERSSVEREASGSFPLRGAPGLLVQLVTTPVPQTGNREFEPRTGHRACWRGAPILPCHTLAFAGPTVEGYQERTDRKVMQVRVLPLLHTRDRNLTGDEAHGEHDNTHYHTLPHSGPTAAGYRLLSARSGFESRHPPPPLTGRSDWVTASKTPQPHRLVCETDSVRRRSSVRKSTAQFLRRAPALLRAEDRGLPVVSSNLAIPTRRADAAWLSLLSRFRAPGHGSAGISRSRRRDRSHDCVSPGRNQLPV